MNVHQIIYRSVLFLNLFLLVTAMMTTASFADFTGRYCELDGAETSSGEQVRGECYFYSDQYGELEGAETSSGETVTGECYRYSHEYAELDGAITSSGEDVQGDCYIY